jgi:hypothetical protein
MISERIGWGAVRDAGRGICQFCGGTFEESGWPRRRFRAANCLVVRTSVFFARLTLAVGPVRINDDGTRIQFFCSAYPLTVFRIETVDFSRWVLV